jgi:sorbitol-specific phosphotransferase system component IIC
VRLFFGFPDDRGLIVPLLVLLLLVLFFLVIIAVGVSRRHRVIYDVGKPPVGKIRMFSGMRCLR